KPKRLFTCSSCDKTFVRLDLLRRHEIRHEKSSRTRSTRLSAPNASFSERGSAEAPSGVTTVPMSTEQTNRVPQSQPAASVDASTIDELHAANAGTFTLPINPSLELDAEFHGEIPMFFDSSIDTQGLSDELDWLFGTISPDHGNADDLLNSNNDLILPSFSPHSTHSHNSAPDAIVTSDTVWLEVREKTMSALHSLPPACLESSFFEPANLEHFYSIYFANYNSHFPILHQASFSCRDASPLLLLSILTLGATLSDPEHFETSEAIHDKLRWLIFSSPGFQPPAPLWCLQALLIIQAHEKMFSSRKHHEMAHIFHGAIITLMRRGSSYSGEWEESADSSSLERAWHLWIEQESSRRASFFAFVMDAQHVSIFGHSPALSVSDIRLPLPCSETVWNAKSASRWKREKSKYEEPPLFLSALRGLLARRPLPSTYSPFARFILLHGLFSVTKHMQERDLTASDVDGARLSSDGSSQSPPNLSEVDAWRDILDRAIETWSLSLLSQEPSLCLEAARPLHRMAHITIHVNLIDFHTFARAPSLMGNKTSSNEHARARKRIEQWSARSVAKRTLSQCLLLIQETMFTRKQYNASQDNIALRPWCLYHATLIVWAYGILTSGSSQAAFLPAEEYLIHMLNGLLVGDGQVAIANRTSGLIDSVRKSLQHCRWELLQEAHATLGNLIDFGP
ncbi:hypothetical protein PV04_07134, partial [Phialophora macrospora]